MKLLEKIPAWLWAVAMAVAYFVPYCLIIIVLLWYLFVFESTKTKAQGHYASTHRRFYILTGINFVGSAAYTTNTLLFNAGVSPLSAATVVQIKMVLLFVEMFFLLWQIVLLSNALSFTMTDEEFKDTRTKIFLSLIFPPIGAFIINSQHKN